MPIRDRDVSWPNWPGGPPIGPGGPTAAEGWLAELNLARPRVSGVREALAAGFVHRDGEFAGPGFAGGGAADRMAPGPQLARLAAEAWCGGLAELTDDELVGVLCAYRRLMSWAAAGELAAVTALAGRRVAPGADRGGRVQEGHLDEEVAVALTLTGRAAARLTGLAAGLARLPGTSAALAEGRIDGPRAAVIADETSALDAAAALAVEERVLPAAPGQTTGQLRAACRRAVLAADPQAGIRRRQRAEKNARVDAWTETSGTGALAGRDLPPAEMIAADQNVDADARWLQAQGAPGTLEQLRAKVFTARLSGRDLHTLLPVRAGSDRPAAAPDRPASAAPDRPASAAPDPAGPGHPAPSADHPGGPGGPGLAGSVNLTMPLAAWLGLSGQPGEVAGLGALDAGACRDLADLLARHPATRWCITVTGPGGQAVAHGCARTGPGPAPPGGEQPGTEPPSSGPPGAGPPGAGPPGAGPPGAGPPGAGPPGAGPPGAGPPGIAQITWLAQVKIRGVETGAQPCTHTRESRGYRPSPALRHLIKIRDRRCSFPGCRRPATRCDDDHTVAYDQGGRTCECNLAPLCRRHHRTKQATGWQLTQPAPGTLTWTPPHQRSYTTTPGHYPD